MSVLVLEDVGLSFGSRPILQDVNLRISETDRIGLIGPNGSGKTTLLRVLSQKQSFDTGKLLCRKNMRMGYLAQDLDDIPDRELLEFLTSSVPGRTDLEAELSATEEELKLAAEDETKFAQVEDLAERVSELHERILHFEQFFSPHEALKILAGLGFRDQDKSRKLLEFSGGWRMRAVLAALLFQKPDLLLLDEPTNHLDMPSVAWFSEFLQSYGRAFILISHDREFLNEQISRVVSFETEGLRNYSGNYESYVTQRAEEEEVLLGKAKNLAREREHMQTFVDRFRASANKAKAVQSRIKALEKMEDVETYAARKRVKFTFPPSAKAPGEVLRTEGLAKSYGTHVVFPGVNLHVKRGEKIALIGANGAGKTTLLRMLAKELAPSGGSIQIGNGVQIGYYAQHHAEILHRDSTVFQEVLSTNPNAEPNRIRALLGALLFSGDDVDKKISVLSGGERARVALAKLLIAPGNLLLMDEPTNHLDLTSSEHLAEALQKYDGTLLFVSHSRSLIRAIATRIWNVENQTVETYPGTLDEYMYSSRQRLKLAEIQVSSSPSPAGASSSVSSKPGLSREEDKERKRKEAELRKLRSQKIGPLEKEVATLESEISKMEKRQAEISQQLADEAIFSDVAKRNSLLSEFQKGDAALGALNAKWERASVELEERKSELTQ